jgi:PRC-barrel domain
MDHPRPGLRYVSVHDLHDDRQIFEDTTVHDPNGERLGLLEGFILNVNAAQPYYVVVDGGGWFKSKHFLLPIGHVVLDTDARRLMTDVTKEHVKRYPGFDLDEFKKMSDDDLYRMSQQIVASCCPDEAVDRNAPAEARFAVWAHYRTPTWWDASYYDPSREKSGATHRG